jgi:hypothetical protein
LSKVLWASSSCISELIGTVVRNAGRLLQGARLPIGILADPRGLRVGLSDKPVEVARLHRLD